jgi:hypothetical protein
MEHALQIANERKAQVLQIDRNQFDEIQAMPTKEGDLRRSHWSIDGGHTLDIFPAGEGRVRYLLGNIGTPRKWVLMKQTIHGIEAKIEWLVALESAPATATPGFGTLAQVLWRRDIIDEFAYSDYPGRLRVPPSSPASVLASVRAVKGFTIYEQGPLSEFLETRFVSKVGRPSSIERTKLEGLTRNTLGRAHPTSAAERLALGWPAEFRSEYLPAGTVLLKGKYEDVEYFQSATAYEVFRSITSKLEKNGATLRSLHLISITIEESWDLPNGSCITYRIGGFTVEGSQHRPPFGVDVITITRMAQKPS